MPAPTSSSPVDVVDDDDRPIGTMPRADVLHHHVNFRTVHILIFDTSQHSLLLQRLGPERDRHPGLVGSSVAGYLHAGEDYADGARRRLHEELSIEDEPQWLGVTSMQDGQAKKFVGIFVLRVPLDTKLVPLAGHIAEVEWEPVADVVHDVAVHPTTYTETFQHVFHYWSSRA